MTEQEKTDWVKALRSGEYRQTRNFLKHSDMFCCLGVKLEAEGFHVSYGQIGDHGNVDEAYQLLDNSMGLRARQFFADLNDGVKLSFEEIALVVENIPEVDWDMYRYATYTREVK